MGAPGDVYDFDKIVEASASYSDAHRGLLKILIDRGSLTEKAFAAHFVRCYATMRYLEEIDYDSNQLNLRGVTAASVAELRKTLLETMNVKANHIGLRLMNAYDESTNKMMVVLVSERHYSPAMTGASPFDNHNELFLVISWLEEMLKPDNDGYMLMNDALKSARDLPVPMKMEKAQQLVDQLLKDDWIRVEAGEMLTLSTRSLTELGPILRSRFHCATCCLCTNVTIRRASMLSCDQCDCLMHISCWKNLAHNANAEKVRCPGNGCKAMLDKDEMDATMAQIEDARNNSHRNRRSRTDSSPGPSTKKGRGRKTVKRNTANADSELEEDREEIALKRFMNELEEEEDDEDELFVRKTQKKSRKQPRHSEGSTQKKPRKKSKEEDDEELMDELMGE